MADLAAITEIFANASEDGTNLTIPLAEIPSFATGNSGRELALGLVQAVAAAIAANATANGAMTNITVNQGQSTTDADTLRKTFNFVFNLSYGVDSLDVEAEPTTTAAP